MQEDSILRINEVLKKTGLRRSTVYKLMKQESFPLPCPLTNNGAAVGWSLNEVQEWINAAKLKRGI